MKPKLVISGSIRYQDSISSWKSHFEKKGFEVIASPNTNEPSRPLTDVYVDFYNAIDVCDAFFLLNEDKGDIEGYIGANGTAELIYATVLKLRRAKPLDIYIVKTPSEQVLAHDEVMSFIRHGWVRVYADGKTPSGKVSTP